MSLPRTMADNIRLSDELRRSEGFYDYKGVGTHLGYVGQWEKSFFHYGAYGLLDPKLPFEAKGYSKALKIPFFAGALISGTAGFALAGVVGAMFDPSDKRPGGIVEWKSYRKHVDPHVQNTKLAFNVIKHYVKTKARQFARYDFDYY